MILNYISWLLFGALTGWVMSQILPSLGNTDAKTDILIGSGASFLTGFVTQLLVPPQTITSFNVVLLIISILGAVVSLATLRTVART